MTGAFFMLFIWSAYRSLYLRLRGRRATGTITGLVRDDSGEGPVYHPVVTFTTATGAVVVAKSSFGTAGAGTYFRIGERVALRYAVHQPQHFAIDGYEVSVVFLAFLAAAGVGGLFYLSLLEK